MFLSYLTISHGPGNHYADRFRASFWHRLRRNSYYADAARVFGRVPLKRLGSDQIRLDVHDTFHFLMEEKDLLNWQSRRVIENVFFFHPNAHINVHVVTERNGSLEEGLLSIFVESGYNLNIVMFVMAPQLEKVKGRLMEELSEEDSAVKAGSLLYKYGGVFLSKSTFLTGELLLKLDEGYTLNDDGSVAFMISKKESTRVLETRGGGKDWTTSILTSAETRLCMEDTSWKIPSTDEKKHNIAITFSEQSLKEFTIRIDTACYDTIEKNCIYCDDLHWEY